MTGLALFLMHQRVQNIFFDTSLLKAVEDNSFIKYLILLQQNFHNLSNEEIGFKLVGRIPVGDRVIEI